MKRIFLLIWNSKQAITGTITAVLSAAASAKWISAEVVVNITTGTGILMAIFALAYTLITASKTPPGAP